jgi:hypothetical protein
VDQRAIPVHRSAGPLLHRQLDHAAKKNPDVPELVRGKSGRVFGA